MRNPLNEIPAHAASAGFSGSAYCLSHLSVLFSSPLSLRVSFPASTCSLTHLALSSVQGASVREWFNLHSLYTDSSGRKASTNVSARRPTAALRP